MVLRPDKEIKVAWVNGNTLAVPAQEDQKAKVGSEQNIPNQVVDVEAEKQPDNKVQEENETEEVSDVQQVATNDTS